MNAGPALMTDSGWDPLLYLVTGSEPVAFVLLWSFRLLFIVWAAIQWALLFYEPRGPDLGAADGNAAGKDRPRGGPLGDVLGAAAWSCLAVCSAVWVLGLTVIGGAAGRAVRRWAGRDR